jgi:hypothetical protein
MWQAAPCLVGDYAMTGTVIVETANRIAYDSGSPSDGPGNIPNQAAGWGEIDSLKAVNAALAECTAHGTIAGMVTDVDSGAPIDKARIEIDGARNYVRFANASGAYASGVVAGIYNASASYDGYVSSSPQPVTVNANGTVTANFELSRVPRHTINGIVRDATSGWPLHARIDIPGYPENPLWTDPVTGTYSVDLPAGENYILKVSSNIPGYLDTRITIDSLDSAATRDFDLAVNTVSCIAPGYSLDPTSNMLTEDFEASGDNTVPTGWTRTTNRPSGEGWKISSDFASEGFPIPSHTVYAASNDDAAGSGSNASQERLITPVLDFSGAPAPGIRFSSYFTGLYNHIATVEYRLDGGAWVSTGAPTTGEDWTTQYLALPATVAGQTNVQLAFRSNDSDSWASGWAIDDVRIGKGYPCIPPPAGGLILGLVHDNGTALNGATVQVVGGGATTSAPTTDPAFPNGFYFVFAPAGSQQITASLGAYAPITKTITLTATTNVRADIDLGATAEIDSIFADGFDIREAAALSLEDTGVKTIIADKNVFPCDASNNTTLPTFTID